MLECALEPLEPLLVDRQGVLHESRVNAHVMMNETNVRASCPEVNEVRFEANPWCRDREGGGSPLRLSFEGGGELKEGWNEYELLFTHKVHDPLECDMRLSARVTYEDGSTQKTPCRTDARLTWSDERIEQSSPALEVEASLPPSGARSKIELAFKGEMRRFGDASLSTSFTRADGRAYATSSPHMPNTQIEAGECDEVLGELAACSSDQSPLCGCDGEVWPGACAASKVGVAVHSASPMHAACHRSHRPSAPHTRERVTIAASFVDEQVEPSCDVISAPSKPREYTSEEAHYVEGTLRSHPLAPSYITPWSGRVDGTLEGRRFHHPFAGFYKQDIDRTPLSCEARSYRMHARTLGAPLREDAPRLVDSDLDGLIDHYELGHSDPALSDTDGDGLMDHEEWQRGLSPGLEDSDADGLRDDVDPAPLISDMDGDGLLDGEDMHPLDPDADHDALIDGLDKDPLNPDQDGDGLIDGAEVHYADIHSLSPDEAADSARHPLDTDGDGLSDEDERLLGTREDAVDTDADGLSDLEEVILGSDPLEPDTDMDGLLDATEYRVTFTDLTALDTDMDGLSDKHESLFGTSALLEDTDGDGLTDGEEFRAMGTLAIYRDTDGGGISDFDELAYGLDPHDGLDDGVFEELEHLRTQAPWVAFSRSPSDPVISARGEIVIDQAEVLSDRLVALPYHQIAHVTTLKISELDSNDARLDLHVAGLPETARRDEPPIVEQVRSEIRLLFPDEDGRTVYVFHVHLIAYLSYETPNQTSFMLDDVRSREDTVELHGHIPGLSSEDTSMVEIVLTSAMSVLNLDELETIHIREVCDNYEDDDGDGQTDCQDEDCEELCYGEASCEDGVDNDQDGLIDCMDGDCVETPECGYSEFEVCDDGLDNNLDGLIDDEDPECWVFPDYEADCANFIDDDSDGFTDRDDPDCLEHLNCSDGLDNDSDGLVDASDPDCALVEVCDDGVDNDGDGFIDCLDEFCALDFFCCNGLDRCGGEMCEDGVDNDFDDLIDCEDDDCDQAEACFVLGVRPRTGLAGQVADACGCHSVTTKPVQPAIPRELFFVVMLGLLWGVRRRSNQATTQRGKFSDRS